MPSASRSVSGSTAWKVILRAAPWLVAAGGGVLWAQAFGIEPQVAAPWLALVPLFLLLGVGRARTAFGLGWLHGTTYWLASIPWIAPTLETFGGLPGWLAVLLLLVVALYLGLFTGLFAGLGARVWRRLPWPLVLVALPALWVSLEWARGWLLSGFPWNLAGYAWTEVPGALPLAAWVGVWGVSWLVLGSNAGLALGVRLRRWPPAACGVLVPLLLLPVAGRFATPAAHPSDPGPGLIRELARDGAAPDGHASSPVRIIQPAIDNQVEYDPRATREGYARLLRMSERACDREGALVVWPESAAWPFELERDPFLARDVERLAARGCPVLLNSTHRVSGAGGEGSEAGAVYYNSAYLVRPPGPDGERGERRVRYDKRHLVPFGEYVPLAGVFSFLDHLARNAGAYTSAEGITLLPWRAGGGDERLGTAICFEVTFPGEVADLVRAGASVLVTLTNDAWYGDSAAPRQHFRAARWRAAETGRPLLRAAITGISGVVGPDGAVRGRLGVGEAGILRARVAGRSALTPFVRAPWAVPGAASAVAAFAIIFAARRRVQ